MADTKPLPKPATKMQALSVALDAHLAGDRTQWATLPLAAEGAREALRRAVAPDMPADMWEAVQDGVLWFGLRDTRPIMEYWKGSGCWTYSFGTDAPVPARWRLVTACPWRHLTTAAKAEFTQVWEARLESAAPPVDDRVQSAAALFAELGVMIAGQPTLSICRQIVEALHLLPDERAEEVSRSIFGYLWQIALGPHATLPLNHQGAMMVATRAAVAVAEGRPDDVDSTLGVCPFCGARLDWMMMSTTPGARGIADCGNGTRARRNQDQGPPCLWAGSTIERQEDGSVQWVQPISLECHPDLHPDLGRWRGRYRSASREWERTPHRCDRCGREGAREGTIDGPLMMDDGPRPGTRWYHARCAITEMRQ